MKIDTQLRLSYYQELCSIDDRHGVKLVRHIESGQIFVLKALKIYDIRVFRQLYDHPIPGVPKINELIEDEDTLYVIEEFISGVSLRFKLKEAGHFTEQEACELVRQICTIISPLHKLNPPIVHRDIKPENLILMSDHNLMLVDFNSAKESHSSQSQDTVLIGTAGYAAPEQYGFSASQPTADIYAIGVLLNELLTGHMPQEQMYQGRLRPVIDKCLQMDPDNRYKRVEDLMIALKVHNTPVTDTLKCLKGWLPPGLRSSNPLVIFFSLFWYTTIFYLSFTLRPVSQEAISPVPYRLAVFTMLLMLTLWIGNYRNMWAGFPLSKSKNPILRLAGVLLWGAVWTFLPIVVLAVVVAFTV